MTVPTQPNGVHDDGVTPCIVLAGRRWPIPTLAPRQNRHVVQAVAAIIKRMHAIAARKLSTLDPQTRADLLVQVKDVQVIGEERALRTQIWKVIDFPVEMSQDMDEELFDHLTTAAFWALKKAHPEFSREEFDDMPIGMIELIDSMGTIAQQTGMMRKVDPSAGPLGSPGSSRSPSFRTGTG